MGRVGTGLCDVRDVPCQQHSAVAVSTSHSCPWGPVPNVGCHPPCGWMGLATPGGGWRAGVSCPLARRWGPGWPPHGVPGQSALPLTPHYSYSWGRLIHCSAVYGDWSGGTCGRFPHGTHPGQALNLPHPGLASGQAGHELERGQGDSGGACRRRGHWLPLR